jgi:UDP:flavonoid glycosyltransferase YjiC (YdhE family)
MILVSMGGIPDDFAFLEDIAPPQNLFLVVPAAGPSRKTRTNIILLPAHSEFYHPDLIQAADVLIGKAGYSTIAEAYYAGIPFGHIDRSDSPEAPILEAFVARSLPGCPISIQDYRSGRWLHAVPRLLDMPRLPRHQRNGAETAADPICALLERLGV